MGQTGVNSRLRMASKTPMFFAYPPKEMHMRQHNQGPPIIVTVDGKALLAKSLDQIEWAFAVNLRFQINGLT